MRDLTWWCKSPRFWAFIVAYMNLFEAVLGIISHLGVVSVITDGFRCDADYRTIRQVQWRWLEIMRIFNHGNPGLYSFLEYIRYYDRHNTMEQFVPAELTIQCYPGMIHVETFHISTFLFNLVWLQFVISYIIAVHKANPKPMRIFLGICALRYALLLIYFWLHPSLIDWLFQILDSVFYTMCFVVIYAYMNQLQKQQKIQRRTETESPPSYKECISHSKITEYNKCKEFKTNIPNDLEQEYEEAYTVTKVTNQLLDSASKPV